VSATYTLIMMAAVATGAVLSRRSQRALALSRGEKLGVCLGAFCGAMIGAKLPFVISDPAGLLTQVRQLRREADFSDFVWTEIGVLDVCSLPGFLASGRIGSVER
jgi:hypothetical protein